MRINLAPGESQSLAIAANSTIELMKSRGGTSRNNGCEISCQRGVICLSIPSALGRYSIAPLSDVFLRAGQSYRIALSASELLVIISTFENSEVMLQDVPTFSPRMMAGWKKIMMHRWWHQAWAKRLDFGSNLV
jgi:hypothetical protein